MTKPYRPSSATEGHWFMSQWCLKCARDKSFRDGVPFEECDDNELCAIIGATMCYAIDDPEYPKEWVCDKDDAPVCTAFVPFGDPLPEPRCAYTRDIFEEARP
jgi:hypothetical protein